MTLNLSLIKRHSLEGLAEGWTDETFVRVEVSSTSEVTQWRKAGLLELTGEESFEQLRKVLTTKIKGGKVLSTKEDGSSELVDFGPTDTPAVVAALPNAVLQEIFQTSLGFPQAR